MNDLIVPSILINIINLCRDGRTFHFQLISLYMPHWITLQTACEQLGVRPQTLYAYVSRSKIESMHDPQDTRKSLYRADDVEALSKRKKAGRKHETLANNTLFGAEPSIPTSLSTFVRGRLYIRGQDVITLAQSASVEDIAQLLWDADQPVHFWGYLQADDKSPGFIPGRQAAFTALGRLAATGLSSHGRSTLGLHQEAQSLVGCLGAEFGAPAHGHALLHERFQGSWKVSAKVGNLLRTAMVLLADHELTSSAFVARIAASTGSCLPACLLAGLGTLSGPLHGDASGRIYTQFADVERLGEDCMIDQYHSSALPIAGFGHPLYPDGDPRATALLALFSPRDKIASFFEKVTKLTGLQPNIDAALAALVTRYRLPNDAAFSLFATARSIGLLAHSMEQLCVAQVIRPRGRYVGLPPVI
jgi:citrate synthase